MLTVTVVNDGTHPRSPEWGRYEYRVVIGGQVVATGEVEHRRAEGWTGLLATISQSAEIAGAGRAWMDLLNRTAKVA